ncbi:MAG TPA: imidazole glycerol phosphate synthase subunit HisH [Dehalococcoidia bacterium]|nr:imidazole glycerol phosphate synthase subunit HisH [Dehalococcoidia bacterium]
MKAIILDYGAGNLRSVSRAVAHAGFDFDISDHPAALDEAEAVILPGVGAAADTMANLRSRDLVEPIKEYIESGRPFLGVCMGLQALMTYSEEGGRHECLDILPGRVIRFPQGQKVPQMGWNTVEITGEHPVLEGIKSGAHFYFVHSYYVEPEDKSVAVAWTDYGVRFPAVIVRDNIVATQFHPEKSGAAGLRFYRNFLTAAARQVSAGAPA